MSRQNTRAVVPVIAQLKTRHALLPNAIPMRKYCLWTRLGIFSHAKLKAGVHCNHAIFIKITRIECKEGMPATDAITLTSFTLASSGMPVTFSHQNHTKKAPASDSTQAFLYEEGRRQADRWMRCTRAIPAAPATTAKRPFALN